MSADGKNVLSMPARWKTVACAVAALLTVGFGSFGSVAAQDASPVAMTECDAPDLPPGAPTDPSASPVAMEDMGEMEEMASPVAEEEDAGTPAEGAVADEILAAANNLAACINGGDVEGAVALMTPNFLMGTFGISNPYDAVEFMTGTTFGDFSASNPRVYEDGSVSADATYMNSQYQLTGETWHLIDGGDYWMIDSLDGFTPEFDGDSAIVGVTLSDATDDAGAVTYSIVPNAPSVAQPEVLLFHAINAGAMDHELVVVQLPEGADPAGLMDGSIADTDVVFVGQITVAAGEQGDMVLIGLPAGVYTMVCFFSDDQGVPHFVNGMVAQFEVTAAP